MSNFRKTYKYQLFLRHTETGKTQHGTIEIDSDGEFLSVEELSTKLYNLALSGKIEKSYTVMGLNIIDVFPVKEGKMSLIDELGGYSTVKNKLKTDLLFGERYYLEKAMLQHRIRNKIFESGDKVVVVINALDNGSIWKVIGSDSCMVEISQVGKPNEWVHYSEIAHYISEEDKTK